MATSVSIPADTLDSVVVQGHWGKVHRGRWHGEVAIRLLEIDGNNQDHLKLFKKEVMNYRQTRHENVILFMGACMAPPHLAIITRYSGTTRRIAVLLLLPHFQQHLNYRDGENTGCGSTCVFAYF